jgi:hypothetical protein
MCKSLMRWSTFILFPFPFCGAIFFHVEPYNGWPRKDQTCVSCEILFCFVPFLSHALCHVRGLRISRPSRFVLLHVIKQLNLLYQYSSSSFC